MIILELIMNFFFLNLKISLKKLIVDNFVSFILLENLKYILYVVR